jgi:hypothetical protein
MLTEIKFPADRPKRCALSAGVCGVLYRVHRTVSVVHTTFIELIHLRPCIDMYVFGRLVNPLDSVQWYRYFLRFHR